MTDKIVSADIPVLPYAGTSGWSGSESSRMRAEHRDMSGKTLSIQEFTLRLLELSKEEGMTWRELSDITKEHHGTTSGSLSVLHKVGRIARLKSRRGRCSVYVSLNYVNGREIDIYGVRKQSKNHITFDTVHRMIVNGGLTWSPEDGSAPNMRVVDSRVVATVLTVALNQFFNNELPAYYNNTGVNHE
jgi:hypothetical protein